MALKKTTQTPFGVEVTDAYHRVEGVSLVGKDQIAFQVRSYKEASGFPHFADQFVQCSYDMNGHNPIKQAYVYLKTTPEFSDAESC